MPIKLDVTQDADVHAAAAACADVNLLINNAGIMLASPMLAEDSEAALRAEMEVNVFGMLRMVRAFAPVLAKNGGGAIANMLSVVSWFVYPFNATYCASKHAALALTEGVRMQLKAQGTQVVAVYAGFIDTDMAAGFDRVKTPPRQVAERTLAGIREGLNDVHADERSEEIWQAVRTDPAGFMPKCRASGTSVAALKRKPNLPPSRQAGRAFTIVGYRPVKSLSSRERSRTVPFALIAVHQRILTISKCVTVLSKPVSPARASDSTTALDGSSPANLRTASIDSHTV